MTLADVLLEALTRRTLGRPALEEAAIVAGFAPAGVPKALWQLKKAGKVAHVRRASRHRRSLYAAR